MAPSPLRSKALHHGRSLSLPSASHPAISQFDENLSRLRSSEATCSSLSSMNDIINGLRNLYQSIDDLLILPHIQQIISEECADDFIKVMDACSIVKDLISLVKQDLRELLFAVRRKDVHGINAYLASRRKSKKMIQKSLKNLRRSALASSEKGSEEMSLVHMLRDAEFVAFSQLESLLAYTMGSSMQERKSSWSLVSKLMQSKKVSDDDDNEFNKVESFLQQSQDNELVSHLKEMDLSIVSDDDDNEFNKVESFLQQSQDNELVSHLKEMDLSIQILEEELENIFRQLIKTRVSLLNILNH